MDCFSTGPSMRKQIADRRDHLYRVAFSWCGEAMVADDLVQEALSIGLQRASQLRDPKCLNGWLYSIMSNCWKQHLRRKPVDIELQDSHVITESNPETTNEEHEIVEHVRNAILRLPEAQRQTITLVDIAGFSYAETATILSIPTGTVMSRLHTARNTLQGVLAQFRLQQPDRSTYIRRVK